MPAPSATRSASIRRVRICPVDPEPEPQAEARSDTFSLTRDEWLESLARIAEKAEREENFSAATAALREIGKAVAGWYAPEEVKHAVASELSTLITEVRSR